MAETPPTPPRPSGGGGGSSAARFLSARQFGMPRWVFLGLIAGAVGIGLYLRSRAAEAEAEAPEDEMEYDPYAEEGELVYDESLAGAGIVPTGGGGSVVPVSAPYLPEGLADVLGGIADIFAVIGENPDAFNPPGGGGGNPTGGGPPTRPNRVLGNKSLDRLKGPLDRAEYRQLRRFLKEDEDQDANVLSPWEWKQLTRGMSRKEKEKLRKEVVKVQPPTTPAAPTTPA